MLVSDQVVVHATVQGMGEDVLGEGAWQTAPAGSVPNLEAVGQDAPTMIPQMDATLLEVPLLATAVHSFTGILQRQLSCLPVPYACFLTQLLQLCPVCQFPVHTSHAADWLL